MVATFNAICPAAARNAGFAAKIRANSSRIRCPKFAGGTRKVHDFLQMRLIDCWTELGKAEG